MKFSDVQITITRVNTLFESGRKTRNLSDVQCTAFEERKLIAFRVRTMKNTTQVQLENTNVNDFPYIIIQSGNIKQKFKHKY